MDKSRTYAALISFYPRDFRDRFGDELIQTHSDQCREVLDQPAGPARLRAWLTLWLRTFADWIVSILREHITDPNRSTGLLEAPPDAPMPWKGVLLVLLPGLIIFTAQIGQFIGLDWFYYLMYRGAYFMIVPVLIVWIWKKRFPVWGLMPFGLLIKTVLEFLYDSEKIAAYYGKLVEKYIQMQPGSNSNIALIIQHETGHLQTIYPNVIWGLIVLFFTASIILLLAVLRHKSGKQKIVLAFGGYILVFTTVAVLASLDYYQNLAAAGSTPVPTPYYLEFLRYDLQSVFYTAGGLLLTVMIGGLFSRRHGRLALLLPFGYLMTSVIYGRFNTDLSTADEYTWQLMLVVIFIASLFRFIVALAGPLWIIRSPSAPRRAQAAAISMALLVLLQIGFTIYLSMPSWGNVFFMQWFFSGTKWCFTYLAGFGLAYTAYSAAPHKENRQMNRATISYSPAK